MDLEPLLNTVFTYNKDINTKNEIFKIIVIVVLICFVFTYIFPNNYSYIIILLVFALWVVSTYVVFNKKNIRNKNKEIMYHLNTLQEITNTYIDSKLNDQNNIRDILTNHEINKIYEKNRLDSLFIDSNMIEFLFSIKKLSEWDLPEFYLLLKGTNNILKIRNEIEEYYNANGRYPDNIYEMFEQTLLLRTNTINNMHRFIYNIPKTNMLYEYINKILERYMVLISRNTDKIYYYIQCHIKITGVNTDTKFITYNTIKPYDNMETDFYV
jgi:hypothetical protein